MTHSISSISLFWLFVPMIVLMIVSTLSAVREIKKNESLNQSSSPESSVCKREAL